MLQLIKTLLGKLFTPPPVPSTDVELAAAEAEIALPESVKRARSWVGKGRYCLGAGGKKPNAADPFSDCAHPETHSHEDAGRVFCDCSGMLCAALGISRKNKDGTWNNTDHLQSLAEKQKIAWKDARPGDALVYGAGKKIGHCCLVSEVGPDGPTRVIHCQASTTPAIKEEGPGLFKRKGALVWRPFQNSQSETSER